MSEANINTSVLIHDALWRFDDCWYRPRSILSAPIGQRFMVVKMKDAEVIRKAMQAAGHMASAQAAALDMLDACDTAIPSERRAALARVREVLEGESNA